MNLYPRMSMMGESHIGSVPGSIPINVPTGITTQAEVTGMSGLPISNNHSIFSHVADTKMMPEQQNHTQLPLRKEVDDEGRICSVVVPETPVPLHTEPDNIGLEEPISEIVKKEEEEDIVGFMDAAHDIFLKISSKEMSVKAAAETLGRPYSFVYSRYQEFCDKVTGDDQPEKKKKTKKRKKTRRKKTRLTLGKTRAKPSGKIYQCEECPAIFYREAQLKTHSKVHAEDNESHKCTACGVVFPKLNKLMRHRIEFHQEALQCPHCDSQFTNISSYHYHIRIHTGEKPYECNECGKTFTQRATLQTHKRRHTGEKPYMCGFCEKAFLNISDLKRHQYVHTGGQDKPFACEQCGQRYLAKSTLDAHMVVHTGEKPYACDICDARFTFKCNAMRHQMVHTGEQPYQCDLCPATFCQAIDLKRHKISHTGIKPFKCEMCDYACTRKSNLELHKYTHTGETPFKCDFYGCDAEFSRPTDLKKHKLQHGPPVPHTCKVCRQQFTEAIALKRHMMTHTGEKPYTCDQCFKTCIDKSALKRHMYKHMYKPLGQKTKQVRQSKKNPAAKKVGGVAPIAHKKWPTEYQVSFPVGSVVTENGHSSQGLPPAAAATAAAAAVGHYAWNINADETNSQPPFHPITASQYTNLVNNTWPSTMDPDEFRRRLLHSFK